MNSLALTALVCALAVAGCDALSCYQCEPGKCKEGDLGYKQTCSAIHTHCLRMVHQDSVTKGCAIEQICTAGQQLDNVLSGNPEIRNTLASMGHGSADKPLVKCCDTDYCNSATSFNAAASLSLMTVVVALFH